MPLFVAQKRKKLEVIKLDLFEAIPGYGIRVIVEGKEVLLGNKKLMVEKGDFTF